MASPHCNGLRSITYPYISFSLTVKCKHSHHFSPFLFNQKTPKTKSTKVQFSIEKETFFFYDFFSLSLVSFLCSSLLSPLFISRKNRFWVLSLVLCFLIKILQYYLCIRFFVLFLCVKMFKLCEKKKMMMMRRDMKRNSEFETLLTEIDPSISYVSQSSTPFTNEQSFFFSSFKLFL